MASNREHQTLEHSARQVLVWQAILTLLLAVLVTVYGVCVATAQSGLNPGALIAIGYGGLLGMLATLIAKRSAERLSHAAIAAPQVAMVPVYTGLINKLLLVGGGLAFGLGVLRLGPIYVVSGYFVTQFAWVLAGCGLRSKWLEQKSY